MKNIISKAAVRGIPNMLMDERKGCGKCQVENHELSSPIRPHQNGGVAREKQNCVSLSTTEAKYLASGSRCSPLVWMNQMQTEYNVTQNVMTLDATQFDKVRGKEGMCASEKL
jgi:hypothetical protein